MPVKKYSRQVRKNPKYDGPKVQWSDAQKLEAVTTYLMVGRWPAVAAALNIPIDTLKHWKMQPWWKEYEADIRRASNLEVSGKLQRIIGKSADLVLDRLDNGEFIFNTRTGKIERRDVTTKVAADILSKAIDKDVLLQKLEVKEEVKEEAIMDRLKSIQDILRKNSHNKPVVIDITPEVIDVQTSDVPII